MEKEKENQSRTEANSSKITPGVNSYFSISLGIQQIFFFIQEKHEQQCLTNMYVYTFFFFFLTRIHAQSC